MERRLVEMKNNLVVDKNAWQCAKAQVDSLTKHVEDLQLFENTKLDLELVIVLLFGCNFRDLEEVWHSCHFSTVES